MINPDDICRLPVPLPDQPVQDYIGAKVRLAERCRQAAKKCTHMGTVSYRSVPIASNKSVERSDLRLSPDTYEIESRQRTISQILMVESVLVR
jgi:hypothetical protein